MPGRLKIQCAILSAVLLTSSAAAGVLSDFVAPASGDGFCWERTYSDAHLARHPGQKVTELRFLLQYDAKRQDYDFNIDIATRERAGTVTGSCDVDAVEAVVCTVTCDSGEVILKRSGSGDAILLKIGETGRLMVNAHCANGGGAPAFAIEAEPDDRIFKLQPASTRTCTVQPFGPFLDQRGK